MEELKKAFYEVMYKYEKSFGETGVMTNLNLWAQEKAGLLELLRRHPNWDEDAKAIVFSFDEGRGIQRDVVDEIAFTMEDLAAEQINEEQRLEDFRIALRAAVNEYSSTLSEQTLEIIRTRGGIKCAEGQKTSRIIGKLCRSFGVDGHERYNAVFAQLSDSLNPLQMLKTALLSLHPCDFLEMSNRDNTWSSCHCLERGSYHGGCQSYMGDAVSMIFFTISDEYTQDFHTAPRITREIFCYKDNVLLQSRLYPTDLEDQKTPYRSIVQQAIATCLDKPNLWSIKRGKDTEPYCESAADSNHYPDYEYGYAVVSLLKGETDYGKMTIGSVARCVCCGGEQKNHRSIRCAECGNMYVCKGCGKTVHGYGRYIDNHFYCNECSYECTVCREKFIGMPRIGISRSGEQRGICPACYEQVVDVCRNCTINSDCLSIGANRFCPNQMNGLAA